MATTQAPSTLTVLFPSGTATLAAVAVTSSPVRLTVTLFNIGSPTDPVRESPVTEIPGDSGNTWSSISDGKAKFWKKVA